MTSMIAALALAPKVLILTASAYGPEVDRHFSPRVAYRSRRIAAEPRFSCACNRFPLGVWLIAEWHGRRVKVWNNDRTHRRYSGRIDFLIGPWKELSGGKKPGLLKGVKVWRA